MESRRLGGELAVEPYLTAGIAVGPFDVLAEIAYEWVIVGVQLPATSANEFDYQVRFANVWEF